MRKSAQCAISLVIATFLFVGIISRRQTADLPPRPGATDRAVDLGPMAENAVRKQLNSQTLVTFPPGRIVLATGRGYRIAGVVVEGEPDGVQHSYGYRIDFIQTGDSFEFETASLTMAAPLAASQSTTPVGEPSPSTADPSDRTTRDE